MRQQLRTSDEARSYAAIKFIYFDFSLRFYPISLILFELFALSRHADAERERPVPVAAVEIE